MSVVFPTPDSDARTPGDDPAKESGGTTRTAADEVAKTRRRLGSTVKPTSPDDVPRPIGPERLKALREAIRNGTYPTDADVRGGLDRMFRRPSSRRRS